MTEDDGCDDGNHLRDGLCARTPVKSLAAQDAVLAGQVTGLGGEWVPALRASSECAQNDRDKRGEAT